jgi:DinB superfamily
MSSLRRPEPAEYDEYYGRYVELVPDGDIAVILRDQIEVTLQLFAGVSQELETYRYAEQKWSIREVVGHLIDTERLFAFRALAMARGDDVDLPGMDQDEWAARSNAHTRPLGDVAMEWIALRRANVHMFASFTPEIGARVGRANGHDFTVRSFPWIIAGHELWHRGLLEEHYLGGEE